MTAKSAIPAAMFLLMCSATLFGQHGTAPGGYYPTGYAGDTWTGEVVSTDDTTREITLSYKTEKKSETFTGVLIDNFHVKMKDGSTKELKPSEIPKAARIIVYYQPKTKKIDGKKVTYNEIFQLNPVR